LLPYATYIKSTASYNPELISVEAANSGLAASSLTLPHNCIAYTGSYASCANGACITCTFVETSSSAVCSSALKEQIGAFTAPPGQTLQQTPDTPVVDTYTPDSSSSGPNIGLIVGVVVAVIVGLGALIGLFLYIRHKSFARASTNAKHLNTSV